MPTKPTDQPEHWATDAVYTTGPFIGQPQKVVPPAAFAAEGHRPGANFPTPAEYENSQQNRITGLCRWVYLGTYNPDPDAHPVETDSTGRAGLHGLTVNNTDAAETGVLISSVGTFTPAMRIANTANGGCIAADIGNSIARCADISIGTGAATGLHISMSGTPAPGAGLRVQSTAPTTAPCIDVANAGTGVAVRVIGGPGDTAVEATAGSGQIAGDFIAHSASLHALRAQGGTLRAVYGVGSGGGMGGEFLSGNTAAQALQATGMWADAHGVRGRTSTSASSTAAGVLGEARGVGTTGVHGNGGTVGRGVVAQADASSPSYSALRIIPQDDDPTAATFDGDTIWHADHRTIRTCIAGHGYRSMPTFGPGSAFMVHAAQTFNTAQTVGGVASTLLSASCIASHGTGFYGSAAGAEVLIKLSLDVRSLVASGTSEYLNITILDVTNAATIATWSGTGTAANSAFSFIATSNAWIRAVSVALRYAPPADGDLEIRVEVSRPAASNNLEIRNAVLEVTGTFAP